MTTYVFRSAVECLNAVVDCRSDRASSELPDRQIGLEDVQVGRLRQAHADPFNILIGLLAPPYGLLLFVPPSMTKKPLAAIVRETARFIMIALLALLGIGVFLDTMLWLPRLMEYWR